MTDPLRVQWDENVSPPSREQPEVGFLNYEALAEAWARRGWLMRAIALCKVILRLEPSHEPTQRLLAELDGRRLDPLSVPEPVVRKPLNREPSVRASRASLLSLLGEEEIQSVMEALVLRDFQPGETIVEEGEPGSSMFAIVEGSVEVVRTLRSGRRRTVAFLGEGDFFGEVALLSDVPRLATVRAFERTAVLELTRDWLDQIIQRHPSVGEVLQSFHRERVLDDVLRGNPLFRLLSPERRDALARDFELCAKPAGTILLEQGKSVDALYLLLRGRCQVLHRHPDGRENLLRTLGEGDMFGEISLMLGLPATATVRADSTCMMLRLDWASCEKHLLDHPGVCEALSKMGTERLLHIARLFWEPGSHEGPRA